VVIIDLVDTAPLRPGALLNDPAPGSGARALVNVSVSRAKAKLIVLADLGYFRAQGAGPVVELLKAIEERGLVVNGGPAGSP
jgi:superfamily I DNA and/or RNA helicase